VGSASDLGDVHVYLGRHLRVAALGGDGLLRLLSGFFEIDELAGHRT
jgi:hypothetical protein